MVERREVLSCERRCESLQIRLEGNRNRVREKYRDWKGREISVQEFYAAD